MSWRGDLPMLITGKTIASTLLMMTRILLSTMATFWYRPLLSDFTLSRANSLSMSLLRKATSSRRLSSTSSSRGVSRLPIFQTIICQTGVPGSTGCLKENQNLTPIDFQSQRSDWQDIYPFLIPLAVSQTTNHVIAAYRDPFSTSNSPWPIVETKIDTEKPTGFSLLALNSEHILRRIVATCDEQETHTGMIDLYNHGLKEAPGDGTESTRSSTPLIAPYTPGSVAEFKYGLDRYILLRVAPFPDIYYNTIIPHHLSRDDEAAALTAAETVNQKCGVVASSYLSYAQLLGSLPKRSEETRDAARNAVRLPLASAGIELEEVWNKGVQLSGLEGSTVWNALETYLQQVKEVEDRQQAQQDELPVPPEQKAIDDVQQILNEHVLAHDAPWSAVRQRVSDRLEQGGIEGLAGFVKL